MLRSLVHGSSPYKASHDRLMAKALGMAQRRVVEYRVANPGMCARIREMHGLKFAWPGLADPFLPKSFDDPYHPGGNSLCYMAQTAHLLGAGQMYAIGFTLQHGSTYFFGREHPLRSGGAVYDVERAQHWLAWFESQHPGRLKLLPGFSGPVYDVLQTEDLDAYRERLDRERPQPGGASAAQPESESVRAARDSGQPAA